MVYERVGKFLDMLSRDAVIVTHQIPVRLIRAHYLGLTPAEMKHFVKIVANGSGLGVPFANLKQVLGLDPESLKEVKQPGIPVADSAHNELSIWLSCLLKADGGVKPENVLIKGDNGAKYPAFKNVLQAFTDNKIFHFKLVRKCVNF